MQYNKKLIFMSEDMIWQFNTSLKIMSDHGDNKFKINNMDKYLPITRVGENMFALMPKNLMDSALFLKVRENDQGQLIVRKYEQPGNCNDELNLQGVQGPTFYTCEDLAVHLFIGGDARAEFRLRVYAK